MFGAEDESDLARYRGIGGWLSVLIVILTILSPLRSIVGLAFSFLYYPLAQRLPLVYFFNLAIGGLDFALSVFGLIAGIMLYTAQSKADVYAQWFLLLFGAFRGISGLFMLIHIASSYMPEVVRNYLFGYYVFSTAFGIGLAAIWYTYLGRSKRVAATYYRADEDLPPVPPDFNLPPPPPRF